MRLAFRQRTSIRRTSIMPWSPYQVICSSGFKGRHRLTKDEALAAAKAHRSSKHNDAGR